MGIEDFKTNTEGDKQNFSEKIENIKKRLESGEGDKQELSDEFLKLWKEAPDNIDDSAHADIDSIRALLM